MFFVFAKVIKMTELNEIVSKAIDDTGLRRVRSRNTVVKIDKKDVAKRVTDFYNKDWQDRGPFLEDRLQRYAKYRGWTEREDLPWDNASDISIPDMMTDSLRLQDTLHNAVMTLTPPITAKALRAEEKDKEENVTDLLHHQLFVEHNGEDTIGEMAEAFVNDGYYIAYLPWVTEDAKVTDIRIQDPIPLDVLPSQYFNDLLTEEFKESFFKKTDKEGWDWLVPGERKREDVIVKFYTRKDKKVEMVISKSERVFDGPKPMIKDIDEVFYPWRAGNLQPPSPSNPKGASHVILADFPTIDEVAKLQKSGFYDLITKKDVKDLESTSRSKVNEQYKDQKDVFQGTLDPETTELVKSHKTVTRLICFDRFDIDGDGLDEDVIFWVIKETKRVLKVRLLTEMFPTNPPRRPLSSASMLPVKDRVIGIGLLEMMEGIHDAAKEIADQMIDAGTLASSPFFFYRATSSLNPEVMTLAPGDGVPMGDPKNDIHFPTINNQSQSFGFNMLTILSQMNERLTMVSDLQRGQIPEGKSAALRTASGIQAVLAQGEARPERILRRFFNGLSEIYNQYHELNQRFLPDEKKILITGNLDEAKDPYQTISKKSDIKGRFQFKFSANILNTSKVAMQEALQSIMSVLISEIAVQMGIIDKDGIYRLMRDFTKAHGQDPKDYIKKPSPQADLQPITAEQAMISIMNGTMPGGVPIAGWIDHLQRLIKLQQEPAFGELSSSSVEIFGIYIQQVAAQAQQEQKGIAAVDGARQFQKQQTLDGQSGAATPDMSNQQVSDNEHINEDLEQ